MYICPICHTKLKLYKKTYICKNKHSFDISAKGYVNLLLTKGRNPAKSGDNPLMVKARSKFLDKNYYLPLAEKAGSILNNIVKNKKSSIIIDSGCGEGFYTVNYAKIVKNALFFGIDISKTAISHCASRTKSEQIKNTSFAVASSFDLPFIDNFADIIVCTFAPVSNDEYARVLKKGGKLVIISPTERHLFGLKEILYDVPYENKPNVYKLNKFTLSDEQRLEYTIDLSSNDDIQNLFAMTPYYYKTSEAAKAKLDILSSLKTECGFLIQTYTKN